MLWHEGDSVKLSSFGSFIVRDKKERIGRNPKTGEEVPIKPRRVMVFKPSNILKDAVLDGNRKKVQRRLVRSRFATVDQ